MQTLEITGAKLEALYGKYKNIKRDLPYGKGVIRKTELIIKKCHHIYPDRSNEKYVYAIKEEYGVQEFRV